MFPRDESLKVPLQFHPLGQPLQCFTTALVSEFRELPGPCPEFQDCTFIVALLTRQPRMRRALAALLLLLSAASPGCAASEDLIGWQGEVSRGACPPRARCLAWLALLAHAARLWREQAKWLAAHFSVRPKALSGFRTRRLSRSCHAGWLAAAFHALHSPWSLSVRFLPGCRTQCWPRVSS